MNYYLDCEFLEGTQKEKFPISLFRKETKPTIDLKYYLYRHIRLDKNEVFYIGIGAKRSENDFSRAMSKSGRNQFWINIISKTDYEVEILFESNDYDFIKSKESEFIKIYGRKDLKQGVLCNLTDGGEGSLGVIVKDSTRRLHSKRSKGNKHRLGVPHPIQTKIIMSESRKGELHPMYGKKHSPESIKKFIKAQTGSKKSEITKEKHRLRATLPNQCNRKPCALLNIETGEKWEAISLIDLSTKCPISRCTLKKLKKGLSVAEKNKKYKFIDL